MKILLRLAAALSFVSCFIAGLIILGNALGSGYKDGFAVAAVGLLFIGVAFFLGGMLLVAAEKLDHTAAHPPLSHRD